MSYTNPVFIIVFVIVVVVLVVVVKKLHSGLRTRVMFARKYLACSLIDGCKITTSGSDVVPDHSIFLSARKEDQG